MLKQGTCDTQQLAQLALSALGGGHAAGAHRAWIRQQQPRAAPERLQRRCARGARRVPGRHSRQAVERRGTRGSISRVQRRQRDRGSRRCCRCCARRPREVV